MIKLQVKNGDMLIEMRGSDEVIITDLSEAIMRMLHALQNGGGHSVSENLTMLMLCLLNEHDNRQPE
ncbi:MAG: hypothetical protein K2O52_04110 [Oscillospiraceae bacterium]|nr:hypothetical protein [Oscillospiraceae bacterium]MDE7094078.1 hypothetical protein [Oscillospiraceae bacterium]